MSVESQTETAVLELKKLPDTMSLAAAVAATVEIPEPAETPIVPTIATTTTNGATSTAANARKRRKELIQLQRSENEGAATSTKGDETTTATASSAASKCEKKPPKKRKVDKDHSTGSEDEKKKTQIRYDPDVEMDKEQLASWRREARRVRNRESAAASRQRIRNRINELEDECEQWKTKYHEAMEKLEILQRSAKSEQES